MRVLDLFSGIGGFSLGLERAGMTTVAFCETDPYCRRVLGKHWPGVPCYGDIRALTSARLAVDGIIEIVADADAERCGRRADDKGQAAPERNRHTQAGIDAICGGFPCQDISVAGKGAGIGGERSGLWSEYRRLVGELRPRYVVVENVAALLNRGLDVVLGDLAALGYDAEWHCIPASAIGAPHRRDRVWIMAHTAPGGLRTNGRPSWQAGYPDGAGADMADADGPRRGKQRRPVAIQTELVAAQRGDWWRIEPDVGRVAHGIPVRVDRLRALGNAVVPQIPELLGRAIMAAEAK